ncbi:sensor histidine kinase [Allostreptomyces psammosilenae]|uniref:histidine kinase n=1 Tax=Allostreptomyces psammosilenae TaxID=1892865 RepID=A0A852ZL55_9ACTN|nr:ATP-binding protein [Allostreptomyces psammosilenae]NYI03139.1 signal transduction histidine kinase [Allostreptomyces psammosilenae]
MTTTPPAQSPPPRPPQPPHPPQMPGPAEPEPYQPWFRPTIRFRLALLYGGMFLVAGVVLLALVYLLVNSSLRSQRIDIQLPSDLLYTNPDFTQLFTAEQFQEYLRSVQEQQRDAALRSLLQQSLTALVLLAVVAFLFGYMMAGRVLQPLGRITRTARQVAGSDLHRRIELDGPDDELKELADTFDEMLDRLDTAFDSQRRFVANASHELRTPLAINRTLLEVTLADPDVTPEVQHLGRTLLATNERSEQLVEGLLLLARSENQVVERKPVDLAEVGRRAVEQTRAEARERGVEVRTSLEPATVQGNGVLLERIALNLLQNGIRYNHEGGWVEAVTLQSAGHALLVVANSGPVVPAYEVDNLFEPFRRLRNDRTRSDKGVGLGLSIVRSVVRAHGGRIEAEPRAEGGLVMRVGLPQG